MQAQDRQQGDGTDAWNGKEEEKGKVMGFQDSEEGKYWAGREALATSEYCKE